MMKQWQAFVLLLPLYCFGQPANDKDFVRLNYTKMESMIPMRDGVRLFTAIYVPKKQAEKFPILMERTPYSCAPYGEANMRTFLGPSRQLMQDGYIFVYQDVRGRYKSEGSFEEMTPAIDHKQGKETDESSDTYDTIEWLLKNITRNNGRVGIYGISYPGFYASAALPQAHPAIRAVSPQAPVTDEFIGDDAYHHGAFFLEDNFDFTNYFQGRRSENGESYKNVFQASYDDAYDFFLRLGPVRNTNRPDLFNNQAKIWNEYLQHDSYDDYWKARNIRPHLKDIRPAVLVVGGWFDAEDMFGALRTYEAIEKQSPHNNNRILMGPWTHGAWSSPSWDHFGTYSFGRNLNSYYESAITGFFSYYLKDKGSFQLPEATVFETGSNQWKSYSTWPPAQAVKTKYFLGERKLLSRNKPSAGLAFDQYLSDPAHPVPYTNGRFAERNNEYLVEDQRFAARRPDVLYYESEDLANDLRVTGPLHVNLYVSTSGTDMDIIVKLIDVIPPSPGPGKYPKDSLERTGLQRLVRAEVFRGKFRNSYEKPEPFKVEEITNIQFDLNEIAHDFKKGHRIMVQVQSSWFPLVDRNPQVFLSIPTAGEGDFHSARIRIYHDRDHPSSIELPVLP